ncbi:MAG: family 20 glycosylhydrolase [Planctomycetota bacterium]|jgi:hexosaminidase
MTAPTELFQRTEPVFPIRAMHLDLKGVPPTPERLAELPRIAAALRFNAMVVEWEDSYPWNVDPRFRSETAYTPDEIRAFCAAADEAGIELIPLVQCLGHMEFVLKFPDYAHLRELPDRVHELNPLAEGAGELIATLQDEVLALMPNVTHFHMGGDEAWAFGSAPDTQAFVEASGKGALYLHHVDPLIDKLAARDVRPMLWHDMMVEWDSEALRRLGERADLVVWGYGGHPDNMSKAVNAEVFKRFADHGISMWGATAYKGADGSNADLPGWEGRTFNARSWAEVAGKYGLKGVITTAWSRYMHLEMQCEPIDGALDTLAAHGLILHDGDLPAAGRDACLELLADIGELERFEAVHGALKELVEFRKLGWALIQQLYENIEVIRQDRHRYATAKQSIVHLVTHVMAGEAIADKLRAALAGSIEPLWLERYLGTRLESLRAAAGEAKLALGQAQLT